jgi:hypothetical protein
MLPLISGMWDGLITTASAEGLDCRQLCILQGRVYEADGVEDKMADAIRNFNDVVAADPRVDVIALPFRDGVNIIMRKYATRSLCTLLHVLPAHSTCLPECSGLRSVLSCGTHN